MFSGGDITENYRDRKSNFSFNVQTVVDAKLKIMYIVARWPGAVHDQTIFNNSHIKQRLINKELGDCVIVGDKGYENTAYLLTPVQNPITPAEHLFNEAQIRSRNVVERTYGTGTIKKNYTACVTGSISDSGMCSIAQYSY